MLAVLDGVEGVETEAVATGSFLVLEEEATVLRAKLGRAFSVGVEEDPASEPAAASASALKVERHIFSSGAALGTFLTGLALGFHKGGLRGIWSFAQREALPLLPQLTPLPLWALDSSGGRLEWRAARAVPSPLLAGALWSRSGRLGSELS